MRINNATIAGGFITGAAGIAVLWAAGVRFPAIVPPGLIILIVAAVFVAIAPWRWVPGVAALIALYVMVAVALNGGVRQLTGHEGAGVAIGRYIQFVGLLTALIAGARAAFANYRAHRQASRTSRTSARIPVTAEANSQRSDARVRAAQVLGLLVLAPVCAEYLAAYDDSTGDAARLLGGLLIFSPLYGGPALIIREVARRGSLGWIGMILLATAFGLLQAGVVDQSLFSVSYRGIESWEESMGSTLIEPLGFSAHMAMSFITGHVIFSICAPIALVEAFRPQDRSKPWLGKAGLAVTAVLYVAASVLVLSDHLTNESSHASALQLVASLVAVCGLVACASVLGRRPRPQRERGAPRAGTVFIVSLVASTALIVVPETWLGVALGIAVLAVAAVLLARASRTSGWDTRHKVSVAAGAVLSRALLAFTYYPVVGDVSATRKYLHNVVLLVMMAAVCGLAVRRARSHGDRAHPDSR